MKEKDRKDQIEILNRLNDDGFLHEIDFDNQLKRLIHELNDNDRVFVSTLNKKLQLSNKIKDSQIDYFTMILSRESKVLDVIYKNFLIG